MADATNSIMVYVFKTTVKSRNAVKQIGPSLDNLSYVTRWNFDLQDCDHILRIEASEFDTSIIRNILSSLGFECIEL